MTGGCWEISVGNSLTASIWNSQALQRYHSPHLSSPPISSQDSEIERERERGGGARSVSTDRAGAAINKVSLLFMVCSECHSGGMIDERFTVSGVRCKKRLAYTHRLSSHETRLLFSRDRPLKKTMLQIQTAGWKFSHRRRTNSFLLI